MRATKKLTLSAMTVALGTVLMVLGGFVEVLDLTVLAVVSLLSVFVYIELHSPYTWLVWLATSLCTFLISPGKSLWLLFLLIFGIFPILKGYIERLKRPIWIVLKLVYINIILAALSFAYELIFSVPLVVLENKILIVGAYAVMNVAFLVYDKFLSVMVILYFEKFRNRIKHLLK